MAACPSLPSPMSKRPIVLLVVVALAAGLGLWASQRHFGAPRVAPVPAVASRASPARTM